MGMNNGKLPSDIIAKIYEHISLKHFDHEVAPRPEELFGHLKSGTGQVYGDGMVPVPGPGEIEGGVAYHHICIPTTGLFYRVHRAPGCAVRPAVHRSGDRADPLQVHSHDLSSGELLGYLQPAAWRRPQVDHGVAFFYDMELFIYLQELVGRSGPVAFLFF